MGTKIFGTAGGTLAGSTDAIRPGAIVTINAGGTVVTNLILVGCSRTQSVDFQVLKSISGDYSFNVFGNAPIYMELEGLQPLDDKGCSSAAGSGVNITAAQTNPIEKWYDGIKLGSKTVKKLDVAVNALVFSGYAYKLMTNPQKAESGGFGYRLWVLALPKKGS